MSEIVSKIHKYGHENESAWPPKYGKCSSLEGDGKGYSCYIDPETKELKEGYPPRKISDAPMVIFDSMPKTYHQGVGREIESRKEWELANKESGQLTFSSTEEPARHAKAGAQREKKEYEADRFNSVVKATQAYKENPKEVSDKVRRKGEEQVKQLKKNGLDTELKKRGYDI